MATTVEKSSGEVIEGPEVTIAMAKADGWWSRKDFKVAAGCQNSCCAIGPVRGWLEPCRPSFAWASLVTTRFWTPTIAPMPADVVVEPGAPQQVAAAEEDPKPKGQKARSAARHEASAAEKVTVQAAVQEQAHSKHQHGIRRRISRLTGAAS